MSMNQITIDGVTYNLVPVDAPKPASPFLIAPLKMNWDNAMAFAEGRDMRLLRSEELHALVRDGHLPVRGGRAWSSSSVSGTTSHSWYVDLNDGLTSNVNKTVADRVVCVPKDFDLATYLKENE